PRSDSEAADGTRHYRAALEPVGELASGRPQVLRCQAIAGRVQAAHRGKGSARIRPRPGRTQTRYRIDGTRGPLEVRGQRDRTKHPADRRENAATPSETPEPARGRLERKRQFSL